MDEAPEGEDGEEGEDAVEEAFFGEVCHFAVAFVGGAHVEDDAVDEDEEEDGYCKWDEDAGDSLNDVMSTTPLRESFFHVGWAYTAACYTCDCNVEQWGYCFYNFLYMTFSCLTVLLTAPSYLCTRRLTFVDGILDDEEDAARAEDEKQVCRMTRRFSIWRSRHFCLCQQVPCGSRYRRWRGR